MRPTSGCTRRDLSSMASCPTTARWRPRRWVRHGHGDLRRVADWTALFGREIGEQPWRQVLNAWWPRLLPGVVAAATHGVIRVGHSVRALLADGDDPSHHSELAHGLA
jgi:hypothetical protein